MPIDIPPTPQFKETGTRSDDWFYFKLQEYASDLINRKAGATALDYVTGTFTVPSPADNSTYTVNSSSIRPEFVIILTISGGAHSEFALITNIDNNVDSGFIWAYSSQGTIGVVTESGGVWQQCIARNIKTKSDGTGLEIVNSTTAPTFNGTVFGYLIAGST